MISLVFEGRIDDKHVVVKVLRKNIREKLDKAFKDLEYVVKKFSKFPKIRNFNIIDIFNENKTIIMDQIEFKKEMEYIKMFQNKWKDIDYVKIPDVYEEYTNILNDVIVMEYIDGKNIHDISEVNKEKYAYLLAKFTGNLMEFTGATCTNPAAGYTLSEVPATRKISAVLTILSAIARLGTDSPNQTICGLN